MNWDREVVQVREDGKFSYFASERIVDLKGMAVACAAMMESMATLFLTRVNVD
jgi:hypothetical protein